MPSPRHLPVPSCAYFSIFPLTDVLKMDTVDKTTRSRMMAAIRSKDTRPEVVLRQSLFHLGYRYRLHYCGLPGKPDLVFPKYRTAVFVNGCFWHHHECKDVKMPSTRPRWWRKKLERNRKRDMAALRELHEQGWRTLVVWECSIRRKTNPDAAIRKVVGQVSRFFRSRQKSAVLIGQ